MRAATPMAALALGWACASAVAAAQPARELPAVPEPRRPELERTGTASDWAAGIGWPSGLAAPEVQAIPGTTAVLTARHRFPDRVVEIRARGAGELQPTWSGWVERVRQAGGTVTNERVSASSASATVCVTSACEGGRYFVSMASDSWLWVVARGVVAAPPTPPGRCVPIPMDEWRICWTSFDERSMCSMPYSTLFHVDVDRDGIADALVPRPRARAPERTCPHEVEWDLYVSRGSCGHLAGRLHGSVERWTAAGAELANGYVVLHTTIDPAGPWDSAITLRYEARRSGYREVARTRHEARCDVHPADCESVSNQVCALRGHPTILGPFDSTPVVALLNASAQTAQRECSAGLSAPIRCNVDATIAPDGTARVRVTDCRGATAACLRRVYGQLTFAPFTGEEQRVGISFQLPPP